MKNPLLFLSLLYAAMISSSFAGNNDCPPNPPERPNICAVWSITSCTWEGQPYTNACGQTVCAQPPSGQKCCNNLYPYDPSTEICCGNGNTASRTTHECCDTTDQGNAPVHIGNCNPCDDGTVPSNSAVCCPDPNNNNQTTAVNGQYCCSDGIADGTNTVCCPDVLSGASECCDDDSIADSNEVCCGEEGSTTATREADCCNNEIVGSGEVCCNGEVKPIADCGVASVSGSGILGQVRSETDSPGTSETIYIAKGDAASPITLTAAPDVSGWPAGSPTWSGAIADGANPSSATFDISTVSATSSGTKVTVSSGGDSMSIIIIVFDLDLITPAGNADNDPELLPIDGGVGTGIVMDGANEFTFSTASPGVLNVPFKAKLLPAGLDRNKLLSKVQFYISDVGQPPTWVGTNSDGMASIGPDADTYVAGARWTGLPSANSSFGKKTAQVKIVGLNARESKSLEVFYPGLTKNHPESASNAVPNWFFYYKQDAGGGSFQYDSAPGARSSAEPGLGEIYIKIGDYVYDGGGSYYTTTINSYGRLRLSGESAQHKYYAHFISVLTHERFHANDQTYINISGNPAENAPGDDDGDGLITTFEGSTSKTDPNDPISAARGTGYVGQNSQPVLDDEAYAGGPIEMNAFLNANTAYDWASPGTNKN